MKHLIIFLNYCRSRLENPVYRQFSKCPADRRDVTLLFLPRPLEERELLHEVADLRRKEKGTLSDVTFHICANFDRERDGESLATIVRMIRRLFVADAQHCYRCLAYAFLPDVGQCPESQTKTVWNNLVVTNNAAAEYVDFRLIDRVYLYHDASQCALAEFLHETICAGIDIGQEEPITAPTRSDWPPIFATFSTAGVTYPEAEVRDYLRKLYVAALLRCSLPEANPTSIETCNDEARRILSYIPIQNARLCLQEEMFLNMADAPSPQWKPVEEFWRECTASQSQGMNDIPHRDWPMKIRERVEATYQTRFRDVGVESFFASQAKKTSTYVEILQAIIGQEFLRMAQSHPYSPETQKTIVRAIVNLLQQKVLELQSLADERTTSLAVTETTLANISSRWSSMKFFARIMKRDDAILTEFTQQLAVLYTRRTQLQGFQFAVKLLNELIPSVQALQDRIETARKVLDEALAIATREADDASPSATLGNFSQQQVEIAANELPRDTEHFLSHYQQLMPFFVGRQAVANGEDLIARIVTQQGNDIDQYLKLRVANGTLPPVIDQIITHRMDTVYADRGGLAGFIGQLKQLTELTLRLKDKNSVADNYVLVTPAETDDTTLTHIITDDVSHIQLLHLQHGVRLTDLDGFSGQRMVIEPTIF